jgi:hypothetical protein
MSPRTFAMHQLWSAPGSTHYIRIRTEAILGVDLFQTRLEHVQKLSVLRGCGVVWRRNFCTDLLIQKPKINHTFHVSVNYGCISSP